MCKYSFGFAILILLAAMPAPAQTLHVNNHLRPGDEGGIGSQYRQTTNNAAHQILNGETREGLAALKPVLAYCDAQLARSNLQFVSFSSSAQYQHYLQSHDASSKPLEWLDMACPSAYYYNGFSLVAERRFEQALPFLEKASHLAPYFIEPLTELGAALNQMDRIDEALVSYRQALSLADSEPLTRYALPMIWRGIGYALVEKHDFEGARSAYQKSLELEPDNKLAQSELDFIEEQIQIVPTGSETQ